MDIEKRTEIIPMTTDRKKLEIGDVTVFSTSDGKTLTGIFKGLSERNTVMFEDILSREQFNRKPASIQQIYKAEITIERTAE